MQLPRQLGISRPPASFRDGRRCRRRSPESDHWMQNGRHHRPDNLAPYKYRYQHRQLHDRHQPPDVSLRDRVVVAPRLPLYGECGRVVRSVGQSKACRICHDHLLGALFPTRADACQRQLAGKPRNTSKRCQEFWAVRSNQRGLVSEHWQQEPRRTIGPRPDGSTRGLFHVRRP